MAAASAGQNMVNTTGALADPPATGALADPPADTGLYEEPMLSQMTTWSVACLDSLSPLDGVEVAQAKVICMYKHLADFTRTNMMVTGDHSPFPRPGSKFERHRRHVRQLFLLHGTTAVVLLRWADGSQSYQTGDSAIAVAKAFKRTANGKHAHLPPPLAPCVVILLVIFRSCSWPAGVFGQVC